MKSFLFAVLILASVSASALECGQVKWWSEHRQFGFITSQNGDYFFQAMDIILNETESNPLAIKDGQNVVFEVAQSRHGLVAKNVKRVDRLPDSCNQ